VARYAGLTGSPDESGLKRREKGLAKAGNARVRRGLIQLAWRFLVFQTRRGGRPRKHADKASRHRAYRARRRVRDETRDETPRDESPRDETHDETLRGRLFGASQGNADHAADISPIRALIEQGCDLEADVVPIVARELPELPRPLKNWGAPWLAREILAAREQRLAGHRVERLRRLPGARRRP
jgi:hypothetical protein